MARRKQLRSPAQRLGMTETEKAVGREHAGEPGDDLVEYPGGEVHGHIAAKDNVEAVVTPKAVVFEREIAHLQPDDRAHTFVEDKLIPVADEVSVEAGGR